MPQPDIEDALDFAFAQLGRPYQPWGDRFGLERYDCSGCVIRSLAEAHIPLPNGISVERKWGNSVSLYNWARDVGGLVSVEKAVRTRGAILIKGKWYGNGPFGDVKFSLGDGRQVGAGSRRLGVATRDVFRGFFQDGFIIPDVFYKDLQPPISPEVLAAIAKLVEWGKRVRANALHMGDPANGDITILNQQLLHRGMLPSGAPMNIFSPFTRDGVVQFKKAHPEIGNIVGKTFGGSAPAVDAMLAPR